MNYRLAFFTITLLFTISLSAGPDRKPLNHGVYDQWKNISRPQLSGDGRWASYEVNPQKGDGLLYIINLQTNRLDSVERGTNARFSHGSEFLACLVKPGEAALRKARAEERSREEMPGDNLYILRLHDYREQMVENVKSFDIAVEGSSWMVYHLEGEPGDSKDGSELLALNPVSGEEFNFGNVVDYSLSDNGKLLLMDVNNESGKSLIVLDTSKGETAVIFSAEGTTGNIATDREGNQAAFLFSPDDNEPGHYSLFHWETGSALSAEIAGAGSPGMPEGWNVNRHTSISFADNGQRLFFGTAPVAEPEPTDTLMEDEKARLDIWHYKDPLIQPMQLVHKENELKRTYSAVYHLDQELMVQLAGENMPEVTTVQNGDGRLGMGWSKLPYLIPNSFESGDYRDVYLVDLYTGDRELLLERHRGSVHLSSAGDPRISPGGNYLVYYSQQERNWFSVALDDEDRKAVNISKEVTRPLYDELHDSPDEPDPYGVAGWTENDGSILVYDRFDIWRLDPAGEDQAVCLTGGYGRDNNIRLRYVDLDPDNDHIGRRERIMLSAFNTLNKQAGFYNIRVHMPGQPEMMVMEDARYFRPQKAADAQVLMWQRSTFTDFPDLHISDMFFNNPRRISHANPQQDKYLWGSVELVEWVSFANDTLQGLLYLPEDHDPAGKYPMIVYFYERSSDGLHMHQVPSPSRSTINRSYCTSNGYIVFVPDIVYRTGYPGQSAYDAIISGTKAMLNRYDFIDRENMGLQGQSWAGYQIAWLITRSDMFRAAMAGAPVSNMVSAYGGIRWSTGMSRIYQYEQTQSRIGGTLWDKMMLYLENSPVFHADRVNTPLLMMHNDADGAVPWYQGIEYFMALRRLGKPVWMLNYNDEAHNLTRRPNMMDLSIRMYQFFDHYLKGEPVPVWMKQGVPATHKGKVDGYRLVE